MPDPSRLGAWPVRPGQADAPAQDYRSPIDGAVLWQVEAASADRIAQAAAAAQSAFARERARPAADRAAWLRKTATILAARREEAAQAIVRAIGKPLKAARFEAGRSVQFLEACAEALGALGGEMLPLDATPQGVGRVGLVRRVPHGVVAAITPFNAPANLLVQKLAPALATGNAVLCKPAPEGLEVALMVAEAFREAGLPEGLLHILPGGPDVATGLVARPEVAMVTLTGGNAAAAALHRAMGPKKFVAELGSNAANIVLADADLDAAATRIAAAGFEAGGQQCISAQRIIVQDAVFDAFAERFLAATDRLKVGDPWDAATDLGPVVSDRAAARILALVADAEARGARILRGPRAAGRVIHPTIVADAPEGTRLLQEEVFGPVVVLLRAASPAEAFAIANATPFGLQASCFTRDLATAFQAFDQIEVGSLWINEASRFRLDNYPFGGVKQSGFGREGVKPALEEFTQPKFLGLSFH